MKSEVINLYQDREDVTLTTYVLDDSPEMLAGASRPAIIICPGGAYMNCSDREAEPIAMRFAAMGYHAFVLRYSVYFEGKGGIMDPMKGVAPKEHCQYPMPMREIGQAMLIVREHAKVWHVDTNKIAICGFSAGAHNCAMYETNWYKPIITDYLKCKAEELCPAAVILGYTLSDYVYMNEKTMQQGGMNAAFFATSNTAFLGQSENSVERLTEVSPARNVTKQTPPTFLWTTAEDSLVPVQHSIRMAHALADAGVPFEVHIFENGPHGYALATQASAGSQMQIDPCAARWIEMADAWLGKRFALDLPEMTEMERMIANGQL